MNCSGRLWRMAEAGNNHECACLGEMNACGDGVDVSFPKELKWYRKAAEQGHADAQVILTV